MKSKASSVYWVVQIIGWGLFCLMIGLSSYLQGELNEYTPYKLIELFVLLIMLTHGMRYLLVKFNWLNLKLGPLISRVLLLNIGTSVLLLLIINTTSYLVLDEPFLSFIEFTINILLYTIFFTMWSAVYLTYHLLRKSRIQELDNLKLEARHHEIELKTLRDQLNPHFLFNSLNSIRALIEIEPSTAKSAITTLSNLLRNSLHMGKKPLVTIAEELSLVKEYLKLEKIRFEERLTYTIRAELPDYTEIPPFLLQSMTENAIKHGISKKADGGKIDIELFKEDDKLYLKVTNTGGKYNPSDKQGIGIINTRRRLEIHYKDTAGFIIKNEEDKVIAYIWIELKPEMNKAK